MIARIRSLAVTPSGSSPSTVMAMVLGRVSGSVWVASTCSTSLVPMPNAMRAEGAVRGGVGVAADDRHARLGQAELRADDVHDALPASPSGCSRTPNSAQFLRSVSTWVRDTGSAIGDRVRSGRCGPRWRWSGRAGGPAGRQTQAVERLRAGHLVDEVQVDVEEVGLALGASYDVLRPRPSPPVCGP